MRAEEGGGGGKTVEADGAVWREKGEGGCVRREEQPQHIHDSISSGTHFQVTESRMVICGSPELTLPAR